MKNKNSLLVLLLFLTAISTPIIANGYNYSQNAIKSDMPVNLNNNINTPITKNTFTANQGYTKALAQASPDADSVSASFYSKADKTLFIAAADSTTNTNQGIFFSNDNGNILFSKEFKNSCYRDCKIIYLTT